MKYPYIPVSPLLPLPKLSLLQAQQAQPLQPVFGGLALHPQTILARTISITSMSVSYCGAQSCAQHTRCYLIGTEQQYRIISPDLLAASLLMQSRMWECCAWVYCCLGVSLVSPRAPRATTAELMPWSSESWSSDMPHKYTPWMRSHFSICKVSNNCQSTKHFEHVHCLWLSPFNVKFVEKRVFLLWTLLWYFFSFACCIKHSRVLSTVEQKLEIACMLLA